jgi:hypothetical protein
MFMARMRLAGRDGRSEHALESFWAGRTTAQEAVRGVSKPAPQFRCEIPADAHEPKQCSFCDGTGVMEVAGCAHGTGRDRTKCSPACLRPEGCPGCFGTGVEQEG